MFLEGLTIFDEAKIVIIFETTKIFKGKIEKYAPRLVILCFAVVKNA